MQNRLNAARQNQSTQRAQLEEIRGAVSQEQSARPESVRTKFCVVHSLCQLPYKQANRTTALINLAAAKQELDTLRKELTQYGACDPAKIEEKKRAVILAKEAAIRWTGELPRRDRLADCNAYNLLAPQTTTLCSCRTLLGNTPWTRKKSGNTWK